MNPASLPPSQKVKALVKALNGAKRTNEALARCQDGDEMIEVLLGASAKLGLGLTRDDLLSTPPIRDWIWWKNKEALLTIGDNRPPYQQDVRPTPQAPAAEGADGEKRKRFFGLF
jgi:hypothetical protein